MKKLHKASEIRTSCCNCSLSELCLPHGMSEEDMNALDQIVKHQQPYQPGQHVFRAGDKSRSLFAVRSGALKSYYTTGGGDEQVLGFVLPGELVGLDGMSDDVYASNSVVLETASICEFSYDDLEELCHSLRGLNHQLMRLASKEINADQRMLLLLGKRTAEEKLAAFLLSLSTRYKPRGLSATNFNLPMSRQDIGNYLGLALETVSRLFAHFQEEGLLKVNRREVTI
ncbi:MAG: fumarate/nitrate reduction transcriptional regulator Fnr, partial [Desulforhopalus sp.]|nr:fumarate/nitrate reduction transcriptional regulator Fnr [Desulforhopalus sp.]